MPKQRGVLKSIGLIILGTLAVLLAPVVLAMLAVAIVKLLT